VRSARQDVALRAILRLQRAPPRLGQVKVAETVVNQKEKQLEMARNRRGGRGRTDLEVLRFEVDLANARTTLLRLSGAADLCPGRPQRGDGRATDKPIRAHRLAGVRGDGGDQQQVVQEAVARPSEVQAVAWNREIYDEAIGIYKGRHAAPARP